MPSTMSGMNSGSEMKPSAAPRRAAGSASRRLAAVSPSMVESSAVTSATSRLLPRACCMALSAASAAYQRVVKPDSGKAMNSELLKEKTGSTSTGRYRKAR